eukprot:6245105-Prymnesium_polylepis.1
MAHRRRSELVLEMRHVPAFKDHVSSVDPTPQTTLVGHGSHTALLSIEAGHEARTACDGQHGQVDRSDGALVPRNRIAARRNRCGGQRHGAGVAVGERRAGGHPVG